jgi:hypothetical protein
MSFPWFSSQASATWPGVADFSSANWRTAQRAACSRQSFFLEAMVALGSPIIGGQLFRPFRGAGQESPPQRAVRDQTDSKLPQRRQNPVLDVALPKRRLALQYGDGLRGMGAFDGLVARFGKAEIKNLAFADQATSSIGTLGFTRC